MFYLQPECDSCLINGNPAILNNKLQDMNFVLNEDNNRIYVKQSDFNSIYRNSERHKKYFSVNDLFTEFYDENTGELTNQTKSLLPGDEVIIKDEIIEINYFEKENYTLIKFNSNNSNHDYHTIMFKGDLTSDYKIGDIINLKFNIIKIDAIGNDIFVDLDYNIQFERTNEVPKIDSFISNK